MRSFDEMLRTEIQAAMHRCFKEGLRRGKTSVLGEDSFDTVEKESRHLIQLLEADGRCVTVGVGTSLDRFAPYVPDTTVTTPGETIHIPELSRLSHDRHGGALIIGELLKSGYDVELLKESVYLRHDDSLAMAKAAGLCMGMMLLRQSMLGDETDTAAVHQDRSE